jgi:hypothetical protein
MNRSGVWVEIRPGLHVLDPFVVQMTFEDPPATVEFIGGVDDGEIVCTGLALLKMDGGPSVTGDWLRRFSFREIWRTAIQMATWRSVEDGSKQPIAGSGFDIQDWAVQSLAPRRKHRITPELLERVAQVYMAASGWPTKAVAEEFQISRSTAATWVGQARKDGFLPPVEKGSRKDKP